MARITELKANVTITEDGDAVSNRKQLELILMRAGSPHMILAGFRFVEARAFPVYEHYIRAWTTNLLTGTSSLKQEDTALYSAELKITTEQSDDDEIVRFYVNGVEFHNAIGTGGFFSEPTDVMLRSITQYTSSALYYHDTIVKAVGSRQKTWGWDALAENDDWTDAGYDGKHAINVPNSWAENATPAGWIVILGQYIVGDDLPIAVGKKVAMSTDATGVIWHAWLEGNNLKVNRLISLTPTSATAITLDSSGDFDSVGGIQFTGGIIRVIVRKESDEKPYCFTSEDFGASWSSAVLIE